MIPTLGLVLLQAAIQALLAASAVWIGLRLLRVRNVLAQKSAWAMVLFAALTMPLLPHWQWLPASVELKFPALTSSAMTAHQPVPAASSAVQPPSPASGHRSALPPVTTTDPNVFAGASSRASHAAASPAFSLASTARTMFHVRHLTALGAYLYLAACAFLLLRLLCGLGAAAWLWLAAKPVPELPRMHPPCCKWLRVSARVPSPVNIGSGVVLPADYAEWDAEKLRIVLAHEQSHVRQGDFYLQIVANLYTALFWFSPLGWWLKRKLSDLSEAISDHAGLHEAASSSSYAQILMEFAALPRPTLIGVGMAHTSNLSHRIDRLLNESHFRQAFAASRRRTLLAVLMVPAVTFATTALVRVQAAEASPAPQSITKSAPSQIRGLQPSILSQSINNAPAPTPALEARLAGAPPTLPLLQAAQPGAQQATFDRTLTVSGQAELTVATGSGDIHLSRGSAGQIRIHGIVKGNRDATEEEVQQIAAHPPIQQNGNSIRVGFQNNPAARHISISYEIEAPADVTLTSTTGSGDIVDDGVGQNAKLTTGSGDIRATGLQGGFTTLAGSGDIQVQDTGEGDAKAQTGSGNIDLKNVHGGLTARTGSGDLKVAGTPSAPWTLTTGSGDVDLWPGNAPMTLDASVGSGDIQTDHPMVTQGSISKHHIVGKLNGGGTEVRIRTGSGDIHVH